MKNEKAISFETYINAYIKYKNSISRNYESANEAFGGSYSGNIFHSEGINNLSPSKQDPDSEAEFSRIDKAFRDEHGEILNQYVCGYSNTAAMLCQKKASNFLSKPKIKYFTQYELGKHPEIEELLIDIDFLAADVSRSLQGKNSVKSLSMIYKVVKNTLSILDSMYAKGIDHIKDDANIAETIEVIKKNLAQAKAYYQRAAKFSVQKNYFIGNLVGFFGVTLLALLTRYVGNVNITAPESGSEFVILLPCLVYYGFIGGGIGAIVSVMSRISSGNLSLSTEPDKATIILMGIIRPLIGALFGGLILILFNSGFNVFTLTADSIPKVVSNFLILSFIAGFFERFVPELLDQTKDTIISDED